VLIQVLTLKLMALKLMEQLHLITTEAAYKVKPLHIVIVSLIIIMIIIHNEKTTLVFKH
jgi:hypothetical protein